MFRLVRCKECGLFRQNPRLIWDSLANYYPDDYIAYRYDDASEEISYQKFLKQYGKIKHRKTEVISPILVWLGFAQAFIRVPKSNTPQNIRGYRIWGRL